MCKEIESPVFQISLRDTCLYSKTRFTMNREEHDGNIVSSTQFLGS
jgi:hypothetical protein